MTKTHEIKLDGYGAHTTLAEDRPIMLLGTAESYGIEMLHVVSGKSWEGLTVTATFNAPDGTSIDMLMDTDGSITVPPEATAKSGSGKIVFTGVSNGIQRISCDLEYFVVAHSAINGVQSGGTAPSWFEQAVTRFMPTGGTAGQVLTKLTDTDFDAKWQDSKGGADGKSAYSYAVDGGYTGTEAEFAAKLAAESIDKALFVVNITHNGDGTYSADKTFDEIVQVCNEGKYSIVANMALGAGRYITPLSAIAGTYAAFEAVMDGGNFMLLITSNNEVQVDIMPLATTNSKLPNPYPLTFTGAVSETYDGSSAKTIEIPSGGGGAFTASYTVAEEVTSYTLNIDTSKYSGYAIFIRNSTNKAPRIIINREHKKIDFTGYDANVSFFEINTLYSNNIFHGFSRLQKNNNTSAAYYSYAYSNKASGTIEGNNGIIITAETIGAGSEIFVRCI